MIIETALTEITKALSVLSDNLLNTNKRVDNLELEQETINNSISNIRSQVIGNPSDEKNPATGIYAILEETTISPEQALVINQELEKINKDLALLMEEGGFNPSIIGDGIFSLTEMKKLSLLLQEISPSVPERYAGVLFAFVRDPDEVVASVSFDPSINPFITKEELPSGPIASGANFLQDLIVLNLDGTVIISDVGANDYKVIPDIGNSIFQTTSSGQTVVEEKLRDLCLNHFGDSEITTTMKTNFRVITIEDNIMDTAPVIDPTSNTTDIK